MHVKGGRGSSVSGMGGEERLARFGQYGIHFMFVSFFFFKGSSFYCAAVCLLKAANRY